MDKLPRVFQNPINHEINNVQRTYISFDKNGSNKVINNKSNISIIDKIDNILNDRHLIRKPNVLIVTDNGDVNTRVVSRTRYDLITIDNKKIPINIVKDIKII